MPADWRELGTRWHQATSPCRLQPGHPDRNRAPGNGGPEGAVPENAGEGFLSMARFLSSPASELVRISARISKVRVGYAGFLFGSIYHHN
jgi:hypothetical protein